MGFFDMNEDKLRALYHRAWHEAGMGYVEPRRYPYLNMALIQYARENQCSYDKALCVAKGMELNDLW